MLSEGAESEEEVGSRDKSSPPIEITAQADDTPAVLAAGERVHITIIYCIWSHEGYNERKH